MSRITSTATITSADVVLEAQGLTAMLGTCQALDRVSMSLKRGQWVAVVGPNGAGKSTLLRCLAGLHKPVAGHVAWAQSAPSRHQPCKLAWLGQDPCADEAMSVRDTVALGRLPHQRWLGWATPSHIDQQAIEQALQDCDMAWAAQRRMGQLSGGERQRVHLARALAAQAPVLLLDEPLAHLDAPHQRLVAQVLRTQAACGMGIISVLHELPWALCADSVLVMQSGRVVAHGERDDTQVHRAMETVFDKAIHILKVQGQWAVLPSV